MESMDISFAQYFVVDDCTSITAIIGGVSMSVPIDLDNRHYAAIMKAVEDGKLIIEPAG